MSNVFVVNKRKNTINHKHHSAATNLIVFVLFVVLNKRHKKAEGKSRKSKNKYNYWTFVSLNIRQSHLNISLTVCLAYFICYCCDCCRWKNINKWIQHTQFSVFSINFHVKILLALCIEGQMSRKKNKNVPTDCGPQCSKLFVRPENLIELSVISF